MLQERLRIMDSSKRSFTSLGRSVAIAAVLLWSVGTVQAAPITFTAVLGPEMSGATGTGFVTVVYDGTVKTLSIDATFSGLSGDTNVAHIHCCTAVPGAGTIGVAVTPVTLLGFPVGVKAGTYSNLFDLTLAGTYTAGFVTNPGGGTVGGAEAALLAGMNAGTAYFNIHSLPMFPGGEIRGFLQPVPEPASLLMLGTALTALAVRRRRP